MSEYNGPWLILCGATVLHRHGWTTQIPRIQDYIILDTLPLPHIPSSVFHPRTAAWFADFADEIIDGNIPHVTPYLALVNAWSPLADLPPKEWQPDPDDLEWDEIDIPRLRALFTRSGVEWPAFYTGWPRDRR